MHSFWKTDGMKTCTAWVICEVSQLGFFGGGCVCGCDVSYEIGIHLLSVSVCVFLPLFESMSNAATFHLRGVCVCDMQPACGSLIQTSAPNIAWSLNWVTANQPAFLLVSLPIRGGICGHCGYVMIALRFIYCVHGLETVSHSRGMHQVKVALDGKS